MAQQKYLTLDEIKAEELKLLICIDDLCRNNGLRYSLVGGSLLGAVRHHGFIPWDDDIDIGMPRPDFDKLIKLWAIGEFPEGVSLEMLSGDPDAPVFVKLVNDEILLRERYVSGINHLWVDIFPIDGMPANDAEAQALDKRVCSIRRLFSLSRADESDGKTALKRTLKRVLVPALNLLNCRVRIGRKLDAISRGLEFGATGYCGILAWGLYGPGERYPDDAFDQMATVEFEGLQLPAIRYWDEYLTGNYGDYMQLPPEDKRKTHELVAWRVE